MGYTIGMPSIKLNNVGQKSKHCGSFKKVAEEALAERLGLDLDINKELTDQNIYKGFNTAEKLIKYSEKHIEELNFNRPEGTRKIRADAVVMCGTILKPPADMMMNLSREEQQKFLEDAVEDFSRIVREDNVKSVVLHFDERVPHAHVFWEPMTSDGRLCAKEMHNLKFFGKLNREMPQMLRKQGWDIDNCQAYDKAEEDKKREEMGEEKYREYRKEQRKNRGKDSKEFKEIAEKKLQETNEKISLKTAELDSINSQIAEAKKIVMTTDIPPRPDVKELPENPTRKERKEHEKQLQAAKEWDDKYKLLQAAQITANANEKAVKAIRHQIQINRENETKIKTSSEQLNLEIKKFHSGIAKNNLKIEKEVERRLAPHNFAQKHQQENERYLQKQRSIFAVALEQAQEQGQEEQQRKQQLFEKAKNKTTKGFFER